MALAASSAAGSSPPASEPAVALISKTILDVTTKEAGSDWIQAKRGEVLVSGDRVKTGVRSLALIKFKDNSMVRMGERSELVVTGQMAGPAFSKSVDLKTGSVGFVIQKQEQNEEFRFSSPTSVASIRGTGGLFAVSDASDTLTVLQGSIAFHNIVSDTTIEVRSGWTGISTPGGGLSVHPSTASERKAAEDAVRTGDKPTQLELELRDGKGHTKELKIDFKD